MGTTTLALMAGLCVLAAVLCLAEWRAYRRPRPDVTQEATPTARHALDDTDGATTRLRPPAPPELVLTRPCACLGSMAQHEHGVPGCLYSQGV